MGRLSDFHAWLDERGAVVDRIEARLLAVQRHYETYFAEITRVREHELQQIGAVVTGRPDALPGDLARALDRARREVEEEFDRRVAELGEQVSALEERAERERTDSREAEKALHGRNVRLDAEEEELKARNEQLLADIESFNERIRALGSGFGFFSNLFRLRALQKEREELIERQGDTAARIEALRRRWAEAEAEASKEEERRRALWLSTRTRAATLRAKLETLREGRARIVTRSTLERVLHEFGHEPESPGPEDPPCPRCGWRNPSSNFFCQVCARRLGEDRPDLAGSVSEIGELNAHHRHFAEGLRACQETIGLLRGLRSGITAFTESVADMEKTERVHPVPKLSIDVPRESWAYAGVLERLEDALQTDESLHPWAFAERGRPLIDEQLTESRIQGWFERMGEELSRQADRQW